MPPTLQIAAGIVLGAVALVALYVAVSALLDWRDGRFVRQARREKRRERRRAPSERLEP